MSALTLTRAALGLMVALASVTWSVAAKPFVGDLVINVAAIPVFDTNNLLTELEDAMPDWAEAFMAELNSLSGVQHVYSELSALDEHDDLIQEADHCPAAGSSVSRDDDTFESNLAVRLRHSDYLEYLVADCHRASAVDVVLLGDSLAFGWTEEEFDSLCRPAGGSCLNLAVSGQSTGELLTAVSDYTRNTCLAPKIWIIQSGADEIVDSGGTADSVAHVIRNIRLAVEALRSEHCRSEVLVMGLTPVTAYPGSPDASYDFLNSPIRPAIAAVNDALQQSLAGVVQSEGVRYVSCGHRLLDHSAAHVIAGALPDGHHLSAAGYALLASCLQAPLSEVSPVEKPTYPARAANTTTTGNSAAETRLAELRGSTQYRWVYGPWRCSSTACGTEGRLTRSPTHCEDAVTSLSVEASLCGVETQQEVPMQEGSVCRSPACRPVYGRWVVSPWGYCSLSCGGGVQNRTVVCLTADNLEVPDQRCHEAVGTAPSLTRSCAQQTCVSADRDDMYVYDEDGNIIGIADGVVANGVRAMGRSSSSQSDSSEEDSSSRRSSSEDSSEKSRSSDASDESDSSSDDSDDSSDSERSSSGDDDSSSESSDDDSSSASDDDDDDRDSSSSDDDDDSSAYSTRNAGRCSRCRRGDVGPWYVEKRLWYQVVWQGSKMCLKGCYKHEDARSGRTYCSSRSGAPKGGCKRSNIERCKKWSGCHDDVDYFVPTCDTCAYLGLNRKTVSTRLVAPMYGECSSGVIAANATCCPDGSLLDAVGDCCTAGTVDACGVCGGTSTAVDMLGQCCKDTELASDGLCCTTAEVDACGVCGGLGTTCSMHASIELTSKSMAMFELALKKAVPSVLGLALDLPVSMDALVLTPSSDDQRILVSGNISFTSMPFDGLSSVTAQVANEVTGVAARLVDVSYAGVCGNGICELGEQTRGSRQGACESDCAFPEMLRCQCGGRGKCIPTSGTCECFVGYDGDWCQDCAHMFSRLGNICVPYTQVSGGDVETLPTSLPELLMMDEGDFSGMNGTVKGMDMGRKKSLILTLAVLGMSLAISFGALLAWHVSFRKSMLLSNTD